MCGFDKNRIFFAFFYVKICIYQKFVVILHCHLKKEMTRTPKSNQKNSKIMETKIFRIAFVMENGKVIYYGYNRKFPFLTYEIKGAYEFNSKYYKTEKEAREEADRLKKYFFGNNSEVESIIMK